MEAPNRRSTLAGLDRWREPAAWVLLATTAAWLILSVIGSFRTSAVDVPRWIPQLSSLTQLTEPGLMLPLAAVALSCALAQPTPRARLVVGLSATLIGLAVVLVVAAGLGLVLGGPRAAVWTDPVGYLSRVVPSAVVVSALVVVFRHLSPSAVAAGESSTTAELEPNEQEPRPGSELEPRRAEVTPSDPTWPMDQAAGAVWHSAGEAAAGAPARRVTPDVQGWQPIPTADAEGPEDPDPGSQWRPVGPPGEAEEGPRSSTP